MKTLDFLVDYKIRKVITIMINGSPRGRKMRNLLI